MFEKMEIKVCLINSSGNVPKTFQKKKNQIFWLKNREYVTIYSPFIFHVYVAFSPKKKPNSWSHLEEYGRLI